ncbi:MAG: putative Cleavage and polyadenylation specificity factor subunit 3, partial [Streblomastix strix]
LDCGIHPAKQGVDLLPVIDLHVSELPLVDVILITHFHLDHAAGLPWFISKFKDFKGKILMTAPTKTFFRIVTSDYIKISAEKPYGEKEIEEAMEKIECINYHQVIEYNGIEITCYNAGHVLGAAMFSITINGMKLLYTGDFSIEPDRLLCGAEVPQQQHDILIVESTYGTNKHEERRRRFN